jgi:hypothetical protein
MLALVYNKTILRRHSLSERSFYLESDTEDIRRHYDSLSDEALLAISRADLTEVAQRCYDAELSARGIAPQLEAQDSSDAVLGVPPEWLKDAACACSFEAVPGNNPAPELDDARNILESAGVPCSAATREVPPSAVAQTFWELMVPGTLILQATSILDKEFFNPQLESEWIAHFDALSDEELRALKLQDLTAGLTDRVERLTKAYKDELGRRGI